MEGDRKKLEIASYLLIALTVILVIGGAIIILFFLQLNSLEFAEFVPKGYKIGRHNAISWDIYTRYSNIYFFSS